MSLDTLKRTNSLDKLLGAVQKENAPLEKSIRVVIIICPKAVVALTRLTGITNLEWYRGIFLM